MLNIKSRRFKGQVELACKAKDRVVKGNANSNKRSLWNLAEEVKLAEGNFWGGSYRFLSFYLYSDTMPENWCSGLIVKPSKEKKQQL